MNFETIKNELKKRISNIKYFNNATFEIILADQKKAKEIVKLGGNAQDFYKNSKTTETKFYKKNGSAYCVLLSIMAENC